MLRVEKEIFRTTGPRCPCSSRFFPFIAPLSLSLSQLPSLNALRAFEASARHLNLTRAALELHVTQTAVSQHSRKLEDHLGTPLFRRLPRGLALTDEGLALLPTLSDAFARMETALEQIRENRPREVLTVGVVGTFAVGWLLPRLRHFQQTHPFVDLRLLTHNNRVDMAGDQYHQLGGGEP